MVRKESVKGLHLSSRTHKKTLGCEAELCEQLRLHISARKHKRRSWGSQKKGIKSTHFFLVLAGRDQDHTFLSHALVGPCHVVLFLVTKNNRKKRALLMVWPRRPCSMALIRPVKWVLRRGLGFIRRVLLIATWSYFRTAALCIA
eukprot:g67252.t1